MKLSKFTRIFTFSIVLVFSIFAFLFIFNFSEYISPRFQNSGINLSREAVWVIGILFCIPCVAVPIMALPISKSIEDDTVFTKKTAHTLSLISKVMLSVCSVFLVPIVLLFVINELTLASILGIVDLLGISIAVHLHILSSYISYAAVLKEETDFTL